MVLVVGRAGQEGAHSGHRPKPGLPGVSAGVGWAGVWYVRHSLTATVSVTVSGPRRLFLGAWGSCTVRGHFRLLGLPLLWCPVPQMHCCFLYPAERCAFWTPDPWSWEPAVLGPPWARSCGQQAWLCVACRPQIHCPVDAVCSERARAAPVLPRGQSRRLAQTECERKSNRSPHVARPCVVFTQSCSRLL